MKNKDVLTLIEQVIAVLVFAVVAAVCLRVFVFSDSLSRQSGKEDCAGTMVRNAAELIRNASGDFDKAAACSGMETENGILILEKDGLLLRAVKVPEETEGIGYADITVSDGGTEICSVRTAWQEEIG